MLPRRFHLRPETPLGTPSEMPGLLAQASLALLGVLVLALVAAFATEALSFLTPSGALAVVP